MDTGLVLLPWARQDPRMTPQDAHHRCPLIGYFEAFFLSMAFASLTVMCVNEPLEATPRDLCSIWIETKAEMLHKHQLRRT